MKHTKVLLASMAIAAAAATALPAAAHDNQVQAPSTYTPPAETATRSTVGSSSGSAVTSGQGSAGTTVREQSTSGMGAGTDANATMRSVPHGPFPDAAARPSTSGMGAGTDANATPRSVPISPRNGNVTR